MLSPAVGEVTTLSRQHNVLPALWPDQNHLFSIMLIVTLYSIFVKVSNMQICMFFVENKNKEKIWSRMHLHLNPLIFSPRQETDVDANDKMSLK